MFSFITLGGQMYKKEGERYVYDGDFEKFLLDIGVSIEHIKKMKEKILQSDKECYYSSVEYDRQIDLVPLDKVVGTSRGTVGESVFENVRTMLDWEREPTRFDKCFCYLNNMTLEELRKTYEKLSYPVDMVYYKDDDEFFLSSDGNHRTLTAMLLGAQNIRANVTVKYCDKEKRKKYLAEQEFYHKYNVSQILLSYRGYKIIFIENNTYFEVDGYEMIKSNENCYSVIERLSNEIEKDRKIAEILLKLPNKIINIVRILLKDKRYFQYIEKHHPSDINCEFVCLYDF